MPNKLLFVLTDGGHARLVERSPETGHFVTLEEIGNHDTNPRHDKTVFVAQVAKRANEVVRQQMLEGVVLAAPQRLIGPLRDAFMQGPAVVEAVAKDLTKVADHDLGAWFGGYVRGVLPEADRV